MDDFDINAIKNLCSSVVLDCSVDEMNYISDGLIEMIQWIEKIKLVKINDSSIDKNKGDTNFLFNEDIIDNEENYAVKNKYLKDIEGVISDYFVVPKVIEGENEQTK